MRKIQVLPPNIANKIAAGEVVERPASVVKELVENALDAGATHITVVISRAGKELIQVIDNGEGIAPDEVELALERHATSKISTVEDLDRIGTLGFRGEALPSIASVSRFELKTRVRESEVGVLLRADGGVIREKETVAAQPGTTVSVKNLFFNTPARRNFLRADSTEFNHIVKWMKRFFLAYPEVHFVLIHNGEELFHLPPGSLDERIVQVFGKAFYEGLAHFREELNDIVLEGYTCRPDQARGTAQNQFIFLNRRAIVNRSLNHAIQQGYGNLLERSRYPQYIMFLTIPPHLVDVNVHPTKMEVRFSNERAMYHLFLSGVRRAVQAQPGGVPSFTMKREHPSREEVQQHFRSSSGAAFPTPPSTPSSRPGDATPGQPPSPASPSQISFEYRPMPKTPQKEPDASSPQSLSRGGPAQANLWQVHNRYIFSQIKSGLVIIDQHVAHERILYEQILDYLNSGKPVPSQQLLFPQTLELSLEDYLIYDEIKEWLAKIGFVIQEMSGRTLMVEAIPAHVKVGQENRILLEMIDFYRENEGGQYQPQEKIAAAFACKNAIKSGEKLTQEEMNALVDQLFSTREPYFCPHGRPVIVTLGLDELDRKFKRI